MFGGRGRIRFAGRGGSLLLLLLSQGRQIEGAHVGHELLFVIGSAGCIVAVVEQLDRRAWLTEQIAVVAVALTDTIRLECLINSLVS